MPSKDRPSGAVEGRRDLVSDNLAWLPGSDPPGDRLSKSVRYRSTVTNSVVGNASMLPWSMTQVLCFSVPHVHIWAYVILMRHGEILYILCDSSIPSPHCKSQWGTFTPLGIWEFWCQSGEVVDAQKCSCVLFSISRFSLPFKLGKLKSFFDRGNARPRTGFCFREVCYLSVPHVIHCQRSVVPAPSLGLCQRAFITIKAGFT